MSNVPPTKVAGEVPDLKLHEGVVGDVLDIEGVGVLNKERLVRRHLVKHHLRRTAGGRAAAGRSGQERAGAGGSGRVRAGAGGSGRERARGRWADGPVRRSGRPPRATAAGGASPHSHSSSIGDSAALPFARSCGVGVVRRRAASCGVVRRRAAAVAHLGHGRFAGAARPHEEDPRRLLGDLHILALVPARGSSGGGSGRVVRLFVCSDVRGDRATSEGGAAWPA